MVKTGVEVIGSSKKVSLNSSSMGVMIGGSKPLSVKKQSSNKRFPHPLSLVKQTWEKGQVPYKPRCFLSYLLKRCDQHLKAKEHLSPSESDPSKKNPQQGNLHPVSQTTHSLQGAFLVCLGHLFLLVHYRKIWCFLAPNQSHSSITFFFSCSARIQPMILIHFGCP